MCHTELLWLRCVNDKHDASPWKQYGYTFLNNGHLKKTHTGASASRFVLNLRVKGVRRHSFSVECLFTPNKAQRG